MIYSAVAQTPLKKCPQCGALAYMNAQACQNCSRPFQTTNPANLNRTQVFSAPKPFPTAKTVLMIGIPIGVLLIVFFVWILFAPTEAEATAALPTSREFHQAIHLNGSRVADVTDQFGEPDYTAEWAVGTVAFYEAADRDVIIGFTGGYATIVKDYVKGGYPYPPGELTSDQVSNQTPGRMMYIDFFNLHGPGEMTDDYPPTSPIQATLYATKDGSVRIVTDHGFIVGVEKR